MKRKQGSTITSSSESQAKKTKPTLETSTVLALQEVLNFSQVKTEEDIERRFNHIAKALLHDFHLVVVKDTTQEIAFEILEVEFYLQIGGFHEDPFTHGSEGQKILGKWHFHHVPRKSLDSRRSSTTAAGYRGGSRKGLDLTMGGALPPVFSKHFVPIPPSSNPPEPHPEPENQQLLCGGILLRSLRQLGASREVISGPSLLVDRIIGLSGASSIADLVANKWAGDTCAFVSETAERPTRLFLRPVPSSTSSSGASSHIYVSPRIGLDLSHPGTTNSAILPLHPRIQFLPKSYRFFTYPQYLVVNGRPQTFLGVLLSCVSTTSNFTEALKKPFLSQEVAALMSLKEPTCAKYLAEYIAGRQDGVDLLNTFVGPKGKGASSSPYSYLRMMGALSNLIPPL